MMVLIFWLLGVLLIVLQTTLLQYLPLWLGRPDFIFIFVAFVAYRFAWIPGIFLVFTLGWILDVVAGIQLGIYPLMCLLTLTGLKLLTNKSPVKEATYQIPLVGMSYFLVQMFMYFLCSLSSPDLVPEWSWGVTLQRTALVTVSAIPMFLLCNSLYEHLLKRQLRGKPPRRRRNKSF
ncbi:rod shape-determining protein MreD [Desulforhopalus sp. 52FAK]